MNQSVYEACIAAITGLTLGSPHVGRNNFMRLTGYSPIPHRMNAHVSLDTWLVWQKAKEESKTPESLGQIFLDGIEDHTDETAYGLMNLRRGFGPPLSGSLDNPLSNGSRALLRSLAWAFLQPDNAGKFAYFDSSIDHTDEGVWLPAALAHAVASMPPVATAHQLWEAFSAILPSNSVMHRVGPHLLENQGHPEAAQVFANQFSARFPEIDRLSIVASISFVFIGLLHADMHAEKAMLLTAGCGGQSDLTTSTSAAIGTYLWGPPPADYINALDDSYIATHSLKHLTPPTSIKEFANQIASSSPEIKANSTPPEETQAEEIQESTPDQVNSTGQNDENPVTIEASPLGEGGDPAQENPDSIDISDSAEEGRESGSATGETSDPNHPVNDLHISEDSTDTSLTENLGEVKESVDGENLLDANQESRIAALQAERAMAEKDAQFKALLNQDPNFTSIDIAGIQITAHYLDIPVGAMPVKKLNLTLKNQSEELKNVKLSLTAPTDWQVASRVTDSAIPQNTETSFPAVIQPPENPGQDNHLRLQLDKLNVLIPFAAAQRYWLLGPFANIEGTGFTKPHPPEKNNTLNQSMSQAFSGRSDLGIRWQEQFFSGTQFDIEPIFNQGPGAAFLYAHITWPAGYYRVQAAFAGGFKLWIDGKPLLSYNDTTVKPPNHPSYAAEFSSPGESRILIKIIRGRNPIAPLSLTFFDESGRIVFPTAFTKDD
jgi:hypothetical protein